MKTTVIIGSYNRPEFLKESISSVSKQTVSCEIIVADCSTVIPKVNTGVKLIHIDENNKSKVWNEAIRQSKGKYIFNMADDDLLADNCIERLENEIEDNDVIFCDLVLLYKDKIEISKQGFYGYEFLKKHNTIPGCVMTTAKAGRKVLFPEDFSVGEDYERNLRFCENDFKIKHLPEALYFYRQHDQQIQKLQKDEQTRLNELSQLTRKI